MFDEYHGEADVGSLDANAAPADATHSGLLPGPGSVGCREAVGSRQGEGEIISWLLRGGVVKG